MKCVFCQGLKGMISDGKKETPKESQKNNKTTSQDYAKEESATKDKMIKKIISGGQTGADQAALDVAIKLGIPHGGWIPKGRLTENRTGYLMLLNVYCSGG